MSALAQQKECRTCKHPIIWAKTVRGSKIPLNFESVEVPYEHQSHSYVFTDPSGDLPDVRKYDPAHDRLAHISHFRTCPDAQEFSKGGRR